MQKLPFFEQTAFLDTLPARVSAQCLRQDTRFHMHRHIQLIYTLSGELSHKIRDDSFSCTRGGVASVLPYTPHSTSLIHSEDTPVIIFISFFDDFLTSRGYDFFPFGDFPRFEGKKIPTFFVPESAEEEMETTSLVREMRSEFERGDNADFDKIASLTAQFLRNICKEDIEKTENKLFRKSIMGIDASVRYIEAHFREKLSIEELSLIAKMSRSTFTSRFREITGISFADFLLSVRLYHATYLLRAKRSLNMDEIAEECGLYDHTNLVRVFKRAFGVTPTEYRESYRQSVESHLAERENIFNLKKWLSE